MIARSISVTDMLLADTIIENLRIRAFREITFCLMGKMFGADVRTVG